MPLAALVTAVLSACGGGGGGTQGAQGVSVDLTPISTETAPGGSAQFAAAVTGTALTSVTWSIQEGSPAGGTVSTTGVYTAPATPGIYHVVATSASDPTKTASSTVSVTSGSSGSGGSWVTAAGAACTNGATTSCEWSACQSEPLHGTVHYYCDCQGGAIAGCVPGNDSNAGTSPSAPRQTIGNAQGIFSSLAAGDTIALCRGGSFGSGGGTWANGNGTAANPVIVRDFAQPGTWQAGAPRPIVGGQWNLSGGAGGYRFLNLRYAGSGSAFGFLVTGATSDASYCSLEMDGYDIAIYVQRSNRHKVTGSRFLNNSSMAWLGDGDGNELRNSYFWNNGSGNTIFLHSIYFGGNSVSNGEVISGNEIHAPANAVGSVLAVHGGHNGTLIENNQILCDRGSQNTAWGLNMKSGDYSSPEMNDNVTIRGNRIAECGNSALVATSCRNCLVENNVILNTTQGTAGISVPCQAADTGKGDPVSSNITVRNNTVYTTQANGNGISVGMEGSGHVVANNAVVVSGATSCYSWPGGASYAERDYNLCWGGSSASPGSHSLASNPLFVNAPSDLRPATSSPAIAAGDPSQTPASDVLGRTRTSPPSIGAFEP